MKAKLFEARVLGIVCVLYSKRRIEIRFSIHSLVILKDLIHSIVHPRLSFCLFSGQCQCMFMHRASLLVCLSLSECGAGAVIRREGGIRVVISHFGLGCFVALWTDEALPGHR